MRGNLDRRTFLQTASVLAAGAALPSVLGRTALAADAIKLSTPSAEKLGWQVSIEIYTFRSMPFYDALQKTAALGVRHVEPGFFLPLDSQQPGLTTSDKLTPSQRKEMKQRMADLGISMPTYYADVSTDRDAAVRAFEFAREMGVETIVSEPPPEAFDMVEKLCDEFAINLAIHNHPKSPDSRYWHPDRILAVCQGRGKRIGACCDTGHWVRSGLRPMDCLRQLEGRIVSFHLKDVGQWAKPEARDVPLGQGLAEYADVLKELKRQGFRGVMAVEYEHESPELMQEVAQCLAFVEKTAAQLS
ncbi:MAG: TIM barrel protein [Pirellulaceae bacterium]|jgi:sugar phosphate isomerase/epimerase|nr:TIM barrel protein [Pirellulaceae bacterium]